MNTIGLLAALSMGFLGSLHCAGMCGPIMMIMPFQIMEGWRKTMAISLYHFGRISVYAAMGLVLHSFTWLFHPAWQQYISVGLGVTLLAIGIFSFVSRHTSLRLPWMDFVKAQTGRFIGHPGLWSLGVAGILNGLLPCGLVYMALSLAATARSGLHAVALLYAFGLGTMPMLIAITLTKGRMKFLKTPRLRSLVPVVMLLFGSLLLLRGMNLGIPYISPYVQVGNDHVLKSDCCHR